MRRGLVAGMLGCGLVACSGCGGPSDSGTDAGTASTTLRIRRVIHHQLEASVLSGPDDAGTDGVEAWVEGTAGFTRVPLTELSPGTLEARPPPGLVYVHVPPDYVATEGRELLFERMVLGRPDVSYLSQTPPALTIRMPADFKFGYLTASVPNAGIAREEAAVTVTRDGGAATLDVILTKFPGTPLLSQARGDVLRLAQEGHLDAGTHSYFATVAAVDVPLPDWSATERPVLNGTLRGGALEQVSFDWKTSDFDALATEAVPMGMATGRSFNVAAVVPVATGLYANWFQLVGSDEPPLVSGTYEWRYFNPYPSNWGTVGQMQFGIRGRVAAPGGVTRSISVISLDRRPLSAFKGAIGPRLSPPRAIRVGGVDGSSTGVLPSLEPVIEWSAPSIGVPDSYRVAVYRIQAILPFVVGIETHATRLRIPPGVLLPKEQYVFKVDARLSPGIDLTTRPAGAELSPDFVWIEASTAVWTTP